jgi:hypothetical protein
MSQHKASIKLISSGNNIKIAVFEKGDGVMICTLAGKTSRSGRLLDGDQVVCYHKNRKEQLSNLSCLVLHKARFRRNLNSILRNLNKKNHPLNRVLVLNKENKFWCIPHDEDLQHKFFRSESKENL